MKTKIVNVIGRKVGELTVVRLVSQSSKEPGSLYECSCSCGGSIILTRRDITGRKRRYCKSCSKTRVRTWNSLVGKKFNRLTVLSYAGAKSHNGSYRYICQCDCGNMAEVESTKLKLNRTKSCGCLGKESAALSREKRRLPKGVVGFRRVLSSYRKNAVKKNRIFNIPEETAYKLMTANCHYCNSEPSNTVVPKSKTYSLGGVEQATFTYNGLDRVDSSKDYTEDNVVSCCKICNIAKHNMTETEFKEWIIRIYENYADK